MAQTTFEMDSDAQRVLDQLKEFYGVKTNAAAIRRALALARLAAEASDEKKQFTFKDAQDGDKEKVVLMAGGL